MKEGTSPDFTSISYKETVSVIMDRRSTTKPNACKRVLPEGFHLEVVGASVRYIITRAN